MKVLQENSKANQINKYKLWDNYINENDESSRERLILEYLPLVKYQASRLSVLLPDFIPERDLESYGIIGLIEALERFDLDREINFKTFASKRIRGAMIDHLRDLDWLPHSLRSKGKEILAARERFRSREKRKPSREELAAECDLEEEELDEVMQYLSAAEWLSLDAKTEEARLLDFIANDEASPLSDYEQKQQKQLLISALEKLSKQEKLVITLYYYEELTQQEIAEILEVSAARVSQIHKKGLQRLRGFLSRDKAELL